ncbi:hypothetical protein FEM48_Zijuj07G0141600 [Ziziphus jujuba var. spinosa]|uniref:Uncharacterized protein n=1 Tax=Ziziphus jujuba var. spinosa TaxID=714518 RepID=A0A978V532_ZIZJJ|nr:hypothetical protein FEM48_Zijuj07G0141600 [Ziziphus jujuba var. spinosa]
MSTTKEDMFDMSDEEYEDGQEIQKNLDCIEIIDAPEIGIFFDSLENLFLHSLSVFIKLQIKQVPENYILVWWRKDLKRCHTKVRVVYDDWKDDHEAQHYRKLQKKLDDVADLAVISNENCAILLNMIDEFQSKASKNEALLENSPSTNTTGAATNVSSHNDGEIKEIHSPLVVRRHGRPSKNKKSPIVEQDVVDGIINLEKFDTPIRVGTKDSTSIQEEQTQVFELYNLHQREVAGF